MGSKADETFAIDSQNIVTSYDKTTAEVLSRS